MNARILLQLCIALMGLLVSQLIALPSKAELTELKFTKKTNVPETRSLFSGGTSLDKQNDLARAKELFYNKKYAECARALQGARTKYPQIAQWVALNELKCLAKIPNPRSENIQNLKTLLDRVEKNKEWFLIGPYSGSLRENFVTAKFVLLEGKMKYQPQEAWMWAEDLLNYQDWMSESQKADAFRYAGEFAFLRQKLSAAKRFLERSLEYRDEDRARSRLAAIANALKQSAPAESGSDADIPNTKLRLAKDENLEASDNEREIYERMKTALRAGDLVAAVEDGLSLIEDFPGGTRAGWASDRILESYLSVLQKTDGSYVLLKQRILKQMLNADSKRLSDWTQQAFKQMQYTDALQLGEAALKKGDEARVDSNLVLVIAKSAQSSGEERTAKKYFQELITKHAGSAESKLALFQLGLLQYRLGENSAATASFERLLVLPGTNEYELETRYWLWRSLQKVDQARALTEAKVMIELYPFTYYGLRALAETSGDEAEIVNLKNNSSLNASLWVTEAEKKSWNRLQLLLRSGWWEEAQAELELLPHPKEPVVRAHLARYWAAAFGYPRAIKLLNEAWDQDKRVREQPFFEAGFPIEFSKLIDRESKKNSLDATLVRSLIRQESAYNFLAKSRSGALGLMQMIPPTAEEVARDIKFKDLVLPDSMYDPETNIKFCTYYLAKLIRQFNGNVPVALAAYNAGPTRVQRWIQSRGINLQPSSAPEYETWIDEIPWGETRFYVKAILRNLILYRSSQLTGSNLGRVRLTSPIWMTDSVATP